MDYVIFVIVVAIGIVAWILPDDDIAGECDDDDEGIW